MSRLIFMSANLPAPGEHLPTPSANLLEILVANLVPGMYVAGLDRPWLETPFVTQGFYVMDGTDIDFVAQHCSYVYVDPRRRRKVKATARARAGKRTYRDQTSLKSEFSAGKLNLTSASDAMKKVFEQLKRGAHFDVKTVQQAIDPLIDSVLRNSEAMAALVRMKSKGEYLYNHSLSNAVWAAVLGRHLGLERKQLKRLAMGAALVDVGMASLPEEITKAPRPLSEAEVNQMRTHVQLGVALLGQSENMHQDVLDTVAAHHERYDGSGYPAGLGQMNIPMFGRVAGLVDAYDAMTTERPHVLARTSFEAMQELADLKDVHFQGELVEQFMQAVGLFPTGAVVELSSGEIGVVVAQNAARRLRPKVVVIIDGSGARHDKLVVRDLAKYEPNHDQATELWITKELEPGAHGIQPDDYFL